MKNKQTAVAASTIRYTQSAPKDTGYHTRM